MSMVADLWKAVGERQARDIQEWGMDELRRLAAKRDEAAHAWHQAELAVSREYVMTPLYYGDRE